MRQEIMTTFNYLAEQKLIYASNIEKVKLRERMEQIAKANGGQLRKEVTMSL